MNEDPSIFEGARYIEREYICKHCDLDDLAKFNVIHKTPESRQQACSWCGKGIPEYTGKLRVIVGNEIISYADGREISRKETINARNARRNNRNTSTATRE